MPVIKETAKSYHQKLKNMLASKRNRGVQQSLKSLDATRAIDYSLWKAIRKLKRPQTVSQPILSTDGKWVRSEPEAETFAIYLAKTFKPNPINPGDESADVKINRVTDDLSSSWTDFSVPGVTKQEVMKTIRSIGLKKAPGYDLITAQLHRELPAIGIIYLVQLFNCIMKIGCIPSQWKVAQVTMILKPGKCPEDALSYRPISLLPVPSKVLERLILIRLMTIIDSKQLIPEHQFEFRQKHCTLDHVHS